MPRYKFTPILDNNLEFYEFMRAKRNNVKNIVQYETQIINNPTVADRSRLTTDTHVWKYGDRYYKLAEQYYGEPTYWWVIALYNGYMTEADIYPGDVISIPVNLSDALEVIGMY